MVKLYRRKATPSVERLFCGVWSFPVCSGWQLFSCCSFYYEWSRYSTALPLDFERMWIRISCWTRFEFRTKLICSMELGGCSPKARPRLIEPMSRKGFLLPIFGSTFVCPWKFWILHRVASLMFEMSFKDLCAQVWHKTTVESNSGLGSGGKCASKTTSVLRLPSTRCCWHSGNRQTVLPQPY